jgi:hypothetical protein
MLGLLLGHCLQPQEGALGHEVGAYGNLLTRISAHGCGPLPRPFSRPLWQVFLRLHGMFDDGASLKQKRVTFEERSVCNSAAALRSAFMTFRRIPSDLVGSRWTPLDFVGSLWISLILTGTFVLEAGAEGGGLTGVWRRVEREKRRNIESVSKRNGLCGSDRYLSEEYHTVLFQVFRRCVKWGIGGVITVSVRDRDLEQCAEKTSYAQRNSIYRCMAMHNYERIRGMTMRLS